jgi:hypothetical protein
MGGAIDQRCRERLAAQSADIDAFLIADVNRVQARRLAAHRVHPGGGDLNVFAIAEQTAEKAFRHWASADVSGTNEEDAFHDFGPARYRLCKVKSNRIKSTQRERGVIEFALAQIQKEREAERYSDEKSCQHWRPKARDGDATAFDKNKQKKNDCRNDHIEAKERSDASRE